MVIWGKNIGEFARPERWFWHGANLMKKGRIYRRANWLEFLPRTEWPMGISVVLKIIYTRLKRKHFIKEISYTKKININALNDFIYDIVPIKHQHKYAGEYLTLFIVYRFGCWDWDMENIYKRSLQQVNVRFYRYSISCIYLHSF